jgi:hypothetical protein
VGVEQGGQGRRAGHDTDLPSGALLEWALVAVAATVGPLLAGVGLGAFDDATGGFHGFVWRKGRFVTVDVPGAISTSLTEINDRGELLGVLSDKHVVDRKTARRHSLVSSRRTGLPGSSSRLGT